jgi:hypothetical protein
MDRLSTSIPNILKALSKKKKDSLLHHPRAASSLALLPSRPNPDLDAAPSSSSPSSPLQRSVSDVIEHDDALQALMMQVLIQLD